MSDVDVTALTPTMPPAMAVVVGATLMVDVPATLTLSPWAVSVEASM